MPAPNKGTNKRTKRNKRKKKKKRRKEIGKSRTGVPGKKYFCQSGNDTTREKLYEALHLLIGEVRGAERTQFPASAHDVLDGLRREFSLRYNQERGLRLVDELRISEQLNDETPKMCPTNSKGSIGIKKGQPISKIIPLPSI